MADAPTSSQRPKPNGLVIASFAFFLVAVVAFILHAWTLTVIAFLGHWVLGAIVLVRGRRTVR